MTGPTPASSDPLETIYTYLQDALKLSNHSGATLAFLTPATLIDPDGFKLHAADAALDPALATQEFTRLTNLLFALDGASATPRLEHLSVQYEMLLVGAQPLSAALLTSFGAVRGVADQLFRDNTVGYKVREGEPPILAQYHPSRATPATWYDPAASHNWTTFSTGASDTTPDPPHRPPLEPPPWRLPRLEFRVLPEEVRPALQRPELITPILQHFALKRRSVAVADALEATPVPAAIPAAAISPSLLSAVHLTSFSATPISATALTAVVRDHQSGTLFDGESAELMRDHRTTELSDALFHAALTPVLGQFINTLPVETPTTPSLTIAFEYCLVEIDRPWFSAEYLQIPEWYIPGYRAGELTMGRLADGQGPLATMPTHLILTRKISISGQWSQADVDTAKNSVALGPFNLVGGSFDEQHTTFTCPGLFVLGVVLHHLPSLPPTGDPGLPAPSPTPQASDDTTLTDPAVPGIPPVEPTPSTPG